MDNQETVHLRARVSVHHPKLAMVSMMLGRLSECLVKLH